MENKKLVFLSVPMKGKEDIMIKRELNVAKKGYLDKTGLKIEQVAFISNYDNGKADDIFENAKRPAVCYLGRAIKRLAACDEMAVLMPGANNAKGCMIERMVCILYDIPVTEVWLNRKGELEE